MRLRFVSLPLSCLPFLSSRSPVSSPQRQSVLSPFASGSTPLPSFRCLDDTLFIPEFFSPGSSLIILLQTEPKLHTSPWEEPFHSFFIHRQKTPLVAHLPFFAHLLLSLRAQRRQFTRAPPIRNTIQLRRHALLPSHPRHRGRFVRRCPDAFLQPDHDDDQDDDFDTDHHRHLLRSRRDQLPGTSDLDVRCGSHHYLEPPQHHVRLRAALDGELYGSLAHAQLYYPRWSNSSLVHSVYHCHRQASPNDPNGNRGCRGHHHSSCCCRHNRSDRIGTCPLCAQRLLRRHHWRSCCCSHLRQRKARWRFSALRILG